MRKLSAQAFTGLSNRTRMVGGGRPILCENLTETDQPLKMPIFNQYSLVRLSHNTSTNVHLTRIGSPLQDFQ